MANQHTKKQQQAAAADPAFAHALAGPTNEELDAKQRELDTARGAAGLPKITFGRSEEEKKTVARAHGEYVTGLSKHHPSLDVALQDWSDLENDPLGQSDPLAALKEKYGSPEIALKLISPGISEHLGMRGYRPVKDANGEVVKCGKQILGYMPEKFAKKRRDDELDAIAIGITALATGLRSR